MKTVRFAQVVERSGEPHVHPLWVAPENDPELKRAQKSDRVMTIEHTARGKADVGKIGFEPPQPGREYLIFPKPLKAFDGTRVVGVKFDLVEQRAKLESAHRAAPRRTRKSKTKAQTGQRATDRREPEVEPTSEPSPENSLLSRAGPRNHGRRGSARESRAASPAPNGRANRRSSRRPPDNSALVHEVRAALAEMRRGESVAAYERLKQAVGDE